MAVMGTTSVKTNISRYAHSKFDFVASGQFHILIYFRQCLLIVLSILSRMQLPVKFLGRLVTCAPAKIATGHRMTLYYGER